jgi:hypothetical protein
MFTLHLGGTLRLRPLAHGARSAYHLLALYSQQPRRATSGHAIA